MARGVVRFNLSSAWSREKMVEKACGNCGANVSDVPRCQVSSSGIVYLCARCAGEGLKECEPQKEVRE